MNDCFTAGDRWLSLVLRSGLSTRSGCFAALLVADYAPLDHAFRLDLTELALALGWSERMARRALADLVAHGFLSVIPGARAEQRAAIVLVAQSPRRAEGEAL